MPKMRKRNLVALGALLVTAALGACSRTSAPPPSTEPSVPVPTAEATPPATTSTVPSAAASAQNGASVWTTPRDCSHVERSDARAVATCEAKEELRAFVAERQACANAAECSIVPGSCPFGCFIPVTRVAEGEVKKELDRLGERLDRAGHRCVYRCMAPPVAACVEGRCAAGPRGDEG